MWLLDLLTRNDRLHAVGKRPQTANSTWLRNTFNYYYIIVLISLAGDEHKQVAAAAICASGQPGPAQKFSSLSTGHLFNGTLATSTLVKWDFEGPGVILRAPSGVKVNMTCITVVNITIAAPSAGLAFLQPTAIDFANGTGLAMDGVTLSTGCQTVLDYQNYFCSHYDAAGSLTLEQGVIHFSSWHDGFTSLDNVTLTCPEPTSAPTPPCWLTAVVTTAQLLQAFTDYIPATAGNDISIVMAANISITNGSWPDTPVPVGKNVLMVGSSRLNRPVLDLSLKARLWDVEPAVIVDLVNLTCINLAPTYKQPSEPAALFVMLTIRMWAFERREQQVHLRDCTLVVLPEELSYLRYWVTFLVSPVPEAQAKAAWLRVVDIKIGAVNDSGLYYEHIYSFTTVYYNVRVTAPAGSGFALQPLELGLGQLQADSVPLSSVRQAMNASDLLAALMLKSSFAMDEEGRRWELLTANMSLADDATWNRGTGIRLPGSTVFGRGPGLHGVYLGLANQPHTLVVPDGAMMNVRNLVLLELALRSTTYDPAAPLDFLASPLWGVQLEGSDSRIRLENTTLLLSAAEVALLQRCLLQKQTADTLHVPASYDAALMAAVQAFFLTEDVLRVGPYGSSYLTVTSGITQRYEMSNVTYRTPAGDDYGQHAVANMTLPGPESGGSGGFAGWKVGVIVGIVGGSLLLLAVVAAIIYRRRINRHGTSGDPGARQRAAYVKYLRNSAQLGVRQYPSGAPGAGEAAGGSGGNVFDLPLPSNGLTNSSQELRPDARTSDVEAPGAMRGLKLPYTNTTTSASGGLGRSRSTTAGGPSPNNSSGARLTPISGPSRSGGRISGSGSALQGSPSATGSSIQRHGGSQHNQTDSFDQPPSSTMLGQHGPVGREGGGGRHSCVMTTPPLDSHASQTGQSQGGGIMDSTGALDQMHAMIQVLGRQFNDRQLEVSSLLGKGAHGKVYRGTWRGLPVAVKSMIFSSDANVRQQQRPLMEAAISSNLAHQNIVTTYAYELREVEHEMASLSPELARQGGGWRLLIIQEYCDAGPLRRIVDCGFFLTPPKASPPRRKIKRPGVGLKDSECGVSSSTIASHQAEPGPASVPASAAAGSSSSAPGSSASNGGNGADGSNAGAGAPSASETAGGQGGSTCPSGTSRREGSSVAPVLLEDLPPDVPSRPGSGLEAAVRYVEAALMIARGLQHIHDKNIVHGDLNPNNVLLVRQPNTPLGFSLKVADFGLSVRMAEGESHMSNLFQGSPYYCAPEVVLSGKIGKPADIYSLGIMLWELQSGTKSPWRMGVRLRTYPSLNTGELDFGPDTPPRYARLSRECFHGSKDARPAIGSVVNTLMQVKAELESVMEA